MEGGDISNHILPKSLVVWENLIGIPPNTPLRMRSQLFGRVGKWEIAVNSYRPNSLAVAELIRVTYGGGRNVDLVTFLPKEAEHYVQVWLETWNIPGRVEATTPTELARNIVYWPNVVRIYDPDESHGFTYGGRGRHVNPYAPDFRS